MSNSDPDYFQVLKEFNRITNEGGSMDCLSIDEIDELIFKLKQVKTNFESPTFEHPSKQIHLAMMDLSIATFESQKQANISMESLDKVNELKRNSISNPNLVADVRNIINGTCIFCGGKGWLYEGSAAVVGDSGKARSASRPGWFKKIIHGSRKKIDCPLCNPSGTKPYRD